ncbi:hypothetical protein O0L34_g12040 [Tuta absoluta]|nr:hypothetical protein O0L34_g12040 [Tuta absoluta]
MICEPCIGRLNDATEFKAMIAESERQLLTNTEITPGPEFVNVAQVDDSGVQDEHKQVNCDLIMKVEEDEWDASDGWRDMITQAVVNKPVNTLTFLPLYSSYTQEYN